MTSLYYTYLKSPVGDFLVAGTETEIHVTAFTTGYQQRQPQSDWCKDPGPLAYALDPLRAYFDGEQINFDIPLALKGTEFQVAVWEALLTIQYGETASYGDIATRLGKPGASRAVGAANRVNCIPVIVPCHRIIGSDGSLTGFGGGLDSKAILLKLENAGGQFALF